MLFKSTLSTKLDVNAAVEEVCASVGDVKPDLAMLFVTHHYGDTAERLLAGVNERINPRNLIGCTGESVIGPDREVERSPAIVLWTAEMPGVRIMPFVVDHDDIQSLEETGDWEDRLGVTPGHKPGFIVLPEPFSFGGVIEHCLGKMDEIYGGAKIVGGLASGADRPGQNRLFLNDQVLRRGMVGVSLSGPISMETVVSQGCRPVGEPFIVTKADENVIKELRGKPAMEVLHNLYRHAKGPEQELMRQGIHLGSVVDELRGEFKPGDFLIRNLMGVAEDTGIAVAAYIRPGQTIQFHVRDAQTADAEMRTMITAQLAKMGRSPEGGLLFSCNGRGSRMFGKANHDVGVVNDILGRECQVAGFFAGGEIGPIGNRTFIHGFTSSLVLFKPE